MFDLQSEFRMHMSGCQWLPLEAQKAIRNSELGSEIANPAVDPAGEGIKALPEVAKQV
jgi:hypothetical protein